MSALPILMLMFLLAPFRGAKDYEYRFALATAIEHATDDPKEQEILARLAWFEGGYRRNVARCEILGDKGKSRGVFQIQGMSAADQKAACGTLDQQTELAVRYIRRSAEQCPMNEGPARLNLYVSGRCWEKAKAGLPAAIKRWGEP